VARASMASSNQAPYALSNGSGNTRKTNLIPGGDEWTHRCRQISGPSTAPARVARFLMTGASREVPELMRDAFMFDSAKPVLHQVATTLPTSKSCPRSRL
jgi:hypothetical protein